MTEIAMIDRCPVPIGVPRSILAILLQMLSLTAHSFIVEFCDRLMLRFSEFLDELQLG